MTLNELLKRNCAPCVKGEGALDAAQVQSLVKEVGWALNSAGQLQKEFKFANFKEALDFTNKVALIAENQDHHPDILLQWGKVTITLYTHSIKGLSLNDFILAAKISQ